MAFVSSGPTLVDVLDKLIRMEVVFYRMYIEQDFEEKYVPYQFEEICRQFLIRENRKGNIAPVFEKIGKYYYDDPVKHTNGEFDIVTQDAKGYIFYEVKFRKNPLSTEVIKKEVEQVKACGLNCYKYVFFSRAEAKENEIEQVELIKLEELYRT